VRCEKLVTMAKYRTQMPKLVMPGHEVEELARRREGKGKRGGGRKVGMSATMEFVMYVVKVYTGILDRK
jgi:hypothetical protein